MRALTVHFKATYLLMRIYIWSIAGIVLIARLADYIVSLFDDSSEVMSLSSGNMLILILLLFAIVLPLRYYTRIVHIGASRQQYFIGLHIVFAVWAAAIALFNSIWFELETNVFRKQIVDLTEAFGWNEFGVAGSFLYQTAFYFMAIALLSMLVSGYYHYAGWLLSALLVAAIPVGTAVSSLRVHVAAFFKALLFNDSLLAGVGFNLMLMIVFLAGGWLFTRGRTH